MAFISVKPNEIRENAIEIIKNEWTLLTAGKETSFNTMTASWGTLGELWGRDVFFAFVRPSRYTYEFFEKHDTFTCSFFSKSYREALTFCGTHSGRDIDKVKETGLTPVYGSNAVWFDEARLVFVCRKLYADDIKPEKFLDSDVCSGSYGSGDFHRFYVGEITDCLTKE